MTLSTHVLDTSRGTPAVGVAVALFRVEGERRLRVADAETDDSGRASLGELAAGSYELAFGTGEFFARANVRTLYDAIPVRFTVDAGESHYHIPLLLSPWGYSTYRGS